MFNVMYTFYYYSINKLKNMHTLICKECGQEISHEKENYCKAKLTKHLKEIHNMTPEEYVVKHYYNGVHPICPCGCGRKLKFVKGWKFTQYASDTCFGKLVKEQNDLIKDYLDKQKLRKFDIKKFYNSHYDKETYEQAFKLFASKEMPLTEVAREYNIDKRTLKRIWLILDICTEKELTDLTNFYRYNFVVERKGFIETDSNNSYTWMYLVIKNNPQKYTINGLKKYYNDKNVEKITVSSNTIYKNLKKIYGDEIDAYLSIGYHSSEEYDFYKLLTFYFHNIANKIEMGKRFETLSSHIIFDFCIDNKLLIEYDSQGKYHSDHDAKIKDNAKEKFAIDNNYKFLRLNKNDILNPNTILKIKELIC